MVGLAGLDVGDQGAQGLDGVGEVAVLLAADGYVAVAVGVGAEAEAVARILAEGGDMA